MHKGIYTIYTGFLFHVYIFKAEDYIYTNEVATGLTEVLKLSCFNGFLNVIDHNVSELFLTI